MNWLTASVKDIERAEARLRKIHLRLIRIQGRRFRKTRRRR